MYTMMTSVSFGGAAACEWKGKAVVNAKKKRNDDK
ncbi:hypothetical protein CGLO_14759 [Colletotrichum gloeosporioides Cg-14]|uniref:Uncharacterized protein n=1 Tax=Colletotrichum gloeosporioides (strain Cg-14) TaxID=1237896 RepID=T0L3H5_COLGC|nr:hypothetical protein CGLO_14759 [Colletotrichum gloeosporioides Cg-14]